MILTGDGSLLLSVKPGPPQLRKTVTMAWRSPPNAAAESARLKTAARPLEGDGGGSGTPSNDPGLSENCAELGKNSGMSRIRKKVQKIAMIFFATASEPFGIVLLL